MSSDCPLQDLVEAIQTLGLHTLPEVALDEDPDNREAEHSINILTRQIYSDLFDKLNSIVSYLLVVVSGSMETYEDVFWQQLHDSDINPRSITVFVNHLAKISNQTTVAHSGPDEELPLIDHSCALLAATIYFTMLRIPGSRTKIFSSFTFRNVMKVLHPLSKTIKTSRAKSQVERKRKRQSDPSQASAHDQKRSGRPSRACRARPKCQGDESEEDLSINVNLSVDDAGLDDDDAEPRSMDLDARQRTARPCSTLLLQALEQAKSMLDSFSLQTFPDSIVHCSEVLAAACFCNSGREQALAFSCLRALAERQHGSIDNGFMNVLKSMVPWFLETPTAAIAATALADVSKKAVAFIGDFLQDIHNDDELVAAQKYVTILYQQLCIRVVDKAPLRVQAGAVVSGLISVLVHHRGKSALIDILKFLRRYARNSKVPFRLFGVELANILLTQGVTQELDEHCLHPDIRNAVLILLQERASDKMPTVRAKSLSSLASAIQCDSVSDSFWASMYELSDERSQLSASFERDIDERLSNEHEHQDDDEDGPSDSPYSENSKIAGSFLDVVKRRCLDTKSVVRKAAVQVIEARALNLIKRGHSLKDEDIEVLKLRCGDLSVMVRKQALDSITALLTAHEERMELRSICDTWVRSCLPMVRDQEQALQERAIGTVFQLILEPLASTSPKSTMTDPLRALLHCCDDFCKPYLQFACRMLAKKRPSGLPSGLAKRIMQLWRDPAHEGLPESIWWIVEEIAEYQSSAMDFILLIDKYEEGRDTNKAAALRTLAKVSSHIPEQVADPFASKLLKLLEKHDIPAHYIHDSLQTAVRLVQARRGPVAADFCQDWKSPLLMSIERVIQRHVQGRLGSSDYSSPTRQEMVDTPECDDNGRKDGKKEGLIRCVFLAGEISMLSGCPLSTRLSNSVQALFTPTTQGRLGPSWDSKELELQGHLLVALGKMSLQDPALAKKCICLFLRELELTTAVVIRNNVLVVLTDLCVRYTSLVDPHIPKLAMCLRDSSDLVRQHALVLITTLLCTDYVKWKGPLFFRYLLALVDDSPLIREQAQQCLLKVLHPKSGHQICFVYLVEALFVLNDNTKHTSYNRFPTTFEERTRFSLPGVGENMDRRREIYRMLLSNCTDEQRFQVTSKICEEILGAVADGALALDDCHDVLDDALYILACKEIKLSAAQRFAGGAGTDDGAEEEGGISRSAAVNAAAKSKLLSQVARRNVMQNVVPTLAALKHVLESVRSPLLGALMRSLAQIMKEYKNEIDDILVSNRQLASELQFDLRQHDKDDAAAMVESFTLHAPSRKGGSGRSPRTQQAGGERAPMTPLSIPRLNSAGSSTSARGATLRSCEAGIEPRTLILPQADEHTGRACKGAGRRRRSAVGGGELDEEAEAAGGRDKDIDRLKIKGGRCSGKGQDKDKMRLSSAAMARP